MIPNMRLRDMEKKVGNVMHKMSSPQQCGTELCRNKNLDCFIFWVLFFARRRSPIGNLFSTTRVSARGARRDLGTTLLPHVVTSLYPLFRYFVARDLLRVILNGMDGCVLKLSSNSCVLRSLTAAISLMDEGPKLSAPSPGQVQCYEKLRARSAAWFFFCGLLSHISEDPGRDEVGEAANTSTQTDSDSAKGNLRRKSTSDNRGAFVRTTILLTSSASPGSFHLASGRRENRENSLRSQRAPQTFRGGVGQQNLVKHTSSALSPTVVRKLGSQQLADDVKDKPPVSPVVLSDEQPAPGGNNVL